MTIEIVVFCLLCAVVPSAVSGHEGNHHECFHDRLKQSPGYKEPEVIDVAYPGTNEGNQTARTRHGFTSQATFSPIRITSVFDPDGGKHCAKVGDTVTTFAGTDVICTEDDVLTDIKKYYIMSNLMPGAEEFLEKALSVVAVDGNLVVSGAGTCGNSPGVTIPSTDQSTGVASTDFLIYVTAVPMTDPESATVAWALACRKDTNGRPVVGQVNWVPSRLKNADVGNHVTKAEDIVTGVHEISHALGFSSPFFGSKGYLDSDGVTYVPNKGLEEFDMSSSLGKTVSKIVSPRVLREARDYFDCATLNGVEIEDQGGAGTMGSHWEKRILFQEFMNGVGANVKTFYSAFTLAYFEDTGHYQADYSAQDGAMNWGRGKGCTFVNEKCSSASNKVSGEFCFESDNSVRLCTYDRLGIGMCDVASYSSPLPSHQQYFTDTSLGAQVSVADYCPAVVPFSNTICIDPDNNDAQAIYGNSYGADSRCYDSTLITANYQVPDRGARCFMTTCSSTGKILLTIDGTTVQCPTDGSAGAANVEPLGIMYRGSINCPEASVVCAQATPAPPTTAAPPTPPPTPLPPGATYAPAPLTRQPPTPPPTLPPTCSHRTPCADGLENFMPACRQLVDNLISCFGTNCDGELIGWLADKGFAAKCQDRTSFKDECQEGTLGAKELCDLITGAASVPASCLLALVLTLLTALW